MNKKPQQQRVEFFNSESSFGNNTESYDLGESRFYDLTRQISKQVEGIFYTLQRQVLPTEQLTNYQKVEYLMNRSNILYNDTMPEHLDYLKRVGAPQESLDIIKGDYHRILTLIIDWNRLPRNRKEGQIDSPILHKQFYNLYGKCMNSSRFFKSNAKNLPKDNVQEQIQVMPQEVVEIIKKDDKYKMSARYHNLHGHSHHNVNGMGLSNAGGYGHERDSKELHEEINRLKRAFGEEKKHNKLKQIDFRIQTENRVKLIYQMFEGRGVAGKESRMEMSPHQRTEQQRLETDPEFLNTLENYKQCMQRIEELESKLRHCEISNRSLQDELNGYRKLENSRMEDFDQWAGRSLQSDQGYNSSQKKDDSQANSHETKKLLKKLTGERDLLRQQLNKERETISSEKLFANQSSSKELSQLRTCLESRNRECEELQRTADKCRVELVQLRQENKQFRKDLAITKEEKIKLINDSSLPGNDSYGHYPDFHQPTKHIDFSSSDQNFADHKYKSRAILAEESVGKVHSFGEYQNAEGIEGYPYYELLSKEFKIRYRRSCLKHKELLYKMNGLEVGVITESVSMCEKSDHEESSNINMGVGQFSSNQTHMRNRIKVFIHITNYNSENREENVIKNLKIKVINPNDNKIEYNVNGNLIVKYNNDKTQYEEGKHNNHVVKRLESNQQLKVPIVVTLKNYPIGPFVLILDYEMEEGERNARSNFDLRLLLPIHIFKCVKTFHRQVGESMLKPIKISIKLEKKVLKDFRQIEDYLIVLNPTSQRKGNLYLKVHHEHSNSTLYLDVFDNKNGEVLDIEYEHIEGFVNFTEYFVRMFITLLEKEHHSHQKP